MRRLIPLIILLFHSAVCLAANLLPTGIHTLDINNDIRNQQFAGTLNTPFTTTAVQLLTTVHDSVQSTSFGTNLLTEQAFAPRKSFGQTVSPYTGFALSAVLITYGVVAQNAPALQNLNAQLDAFAREKFPHRFHLDDWIQYVPTAVYLGFDIAGVESRHPFLQRTAVAASSFIIMAAIVNIMKWSIPVLRPDGSAYNSFPSGHTATAFTGAHLLGKEYGRYYPWVSAAGYVTATTTGLCRIANKRHWLSDVAAGAGIGIISVELAWLLMPVFDRWFDRWQKPSSNSIDISIAPALSYNTFGTAIVCTF